MAATSTTTSSADVPVSGQRATTSPVRLGLPVALAVVALAGVGVALVADAGGDTDVKSALRTAPAFALEGVRDPSARVTLGGGGRPVVVNFFAAWCVPCRAELPVLQRASERLAGSVDFVGIDVADSRTAASELLDSAGVTFPAGYDPDRTVASSYRLQGMPTTVFVDAGGRVAEVARGGLNAAELDRHLTRLAPSAWAGRKGPE
jgi:thiol-disulfide isomerase/thioredoxin